MLAILVFTFVSIAISQDIPGCTYGYACNYNPEATIEDGSCIWPAECNEWCPGDPGEPLYPDMCGTCDENPFNDCEQDCNGDWGGIAYIDECGVCCGGETGVECSYYNYSSIGNCNNSEFGGAYDCNGECFGEYFLDECGCCSNWFGSQFTDCYGDCFGDAFENECGCVSGSTGLDPDFCHGCTDPNSCNFNPDATWDDGSCNCLGDANLDNEIDILDVVFIVEFIL